MNRNTMRLCVPDGTGAGSALPAVRPVPSGNLHGRAAQAIDRRGARADASQSWCSGEGGLRVRATRVWVAWMFVEPLAGWRTAPVSDQLNTHRLASLYEAFPPQEALRLARKLELVHTPKHGIWLNMDEPELSVLTRQCLGQRIGDMARVRQLAQQWATARNQRQMGIDWHFRTAETRTRLKCLIRKSKSDGLLGIQGIASLQFHLLMHRGSFCPHD